MQDNVQITYMKFLWKLRQRELQLSDFSYETTEPIVRKFYFSIYVMIIQSIAKKLMIRNSKWPPCPYMEKNIQTTSSPESLGQFGWYFAERIRDTTLYLIAKIIPVGS